MGIKERRDFEKAEMKKRIMDASIELINEEGYEKLSIRKIAAKIEYSPTTIYLYYKDKAEIIADMSNELYRKVERNATLIGSSAVVSVDQKIHRILYTVIMSLCDKPEMAKAIMYSGANFIFANECENETPANPGIAMLDDLFAEGIALKVLRPNLANTSWMVISALLGFVMCTIENQLCKLDNFDRNVDDFVEILLGGMRQ